MCMKKIFLVLVAMLCVATVSAKSKFESSVKQAAQTIASQKWSVGLRVGSGLQAQAECFYADNKYFEAILGMGFGNKVDGKVRLGVDFTLLHNWNCCNWNWTPSAGRWFLDAGAGVNVGGSAKGLWCGVAGQAKFGIKFNDVPIRLAVDVTPVIGPWISYGYKSTVEKPVFDDAGQEIGVDRVTVKHPATAGFRGLGLIGVALSATYCF